MKQIKPTHNLKNIARKVLLPVVLIAVSTLSGCDRFLAPLGKELPQVKQTAPVETASFPQTIAFVGYLEAAQSEIVTWKTGGVIESCPVEAGKSVMRGDELARLETDSLSTMIFEAENTKISSETNLHDLETSDTAKVKAYQDMIEKEKALADAKKLLAGLDYPVASVSDLASAERAMVAARDAYDNAIADFEGVKLRPDTDPERYEKKKKLQAAMNAFFQANNVYVYYRDGVSEAAKAQARASVLKAEAAYEEAVRVYETFGDSTYREADYTEKLKAGDVAAKIVSRQSPTAGITGMVSAYNCEVGAYVTSGKVLAKISDLSSLYFRVNVSEFDRDRIRVGMETEIRFDPFPDAVLKGTIVSIDATATGKSGVPSVSVSIRLEENDEADMARLYPGMTGSVLIQLIPRENVLSIPINALQTDEKGTFVEVLENNGTIKRVDVETGDFTVDRIEILSGSLKQGDQVVLTEKK